ncbi:hypothetical protein [Tabrizicola sp.]|uniref:COG4223 family protein n=1 Tax=Tabrizicola sp. TaxID=2005166 RepID=UPI00286D2389|nr:hypothetical protein [Tabrizicola sp.]
MARKTTPEPQAPLILLDDAPAQPDAAARPVPDIPTTPQPPEPPVQPPTRQSGFFPALAGGALAAVIGFGLSHYDAFGLRGAAPSADLSPALDQQATEIAALKTALQAAQTALTERLAGIEATLAALPTPTDPAKDDARFAALDQRLAAIEALPPGEAGTSPALAAAVRDLQARVAALGTSSTLPDALAAKVDDAVKRLSDAEAAATAKAAEAEVMAATARRAAVLDRLAAAVASGTPYSDILADLANEAVPAALSDHAETGIGTLASLQQSFPDGARAALQLARAASSDSSWGSRLMDFLQAQTGARSLTPREGTDPDAVLSRAEAAVQEGRLADALTELSTLDPAVAVPLADWSALAKQRLDAETALSALAAQTAPQGE